ncbi:hypothetical protein G6F32_014562 [Rhizopus arrhizus]|nr:hypothetical protein G6F32_014562 [Rhizopus arrhizus]
MQHLGRQAVQHQAVARAQCRHGHQRMAVVDQDQMLRRAQQFGGVDADGVVQLQRIARAPEIVIGQHQLIQRREQFDGALQVQEVQLALRHVFELERRVLDHREIDGFRRVHFHARLAQRLVQPDDEVEEVQVVFDEQLVLQVVDL